ncbi:MAG TPA: hypothetical protein VMS43_13760 [Allosphingosinicella sp.]|nr:hypothetical protein [Allosphingosinicella sp.]
MRKASAKWIITLVAFVSLGTAILSFGDTALRLFKSPDNAAHHDVPETIILQVSGTEHVVTHQSGTNNSL